MATRQPPAAIRFNNPGAMYPGPVSRHFGSTRTEIIGGGRHKIAVFPSAEAGAAAHIGLLARSYTGMTLNDAIKKWSGGNSNAAYADYVAKQTGLSRDTVITKSMLADPRVGIPFARAQATWEAGQPSPLTDAQWREGHRLAVMSPFSERGPIQQRTLPSPTTPPTPGVDPFEATRRMMAQTTEPQQAREPWQNVPPLPTLASTEAPLRASRFARPEMAPQTPGQAPQMGVVDPMNPGPEPTGPIQPIDTTQTAPVPRNNPSPKPGIGPMAPGGGGGGGSNWAMEAFERQGNMPVDRVGGGNSNMLPPPPPPPPSTDDWMMTKFPKLSMLFQGNGGGGFFSGGL